MSEVRARDNSRRSSSTTVIGHSYCGTGTTSPRRRRHGAGCEFHDGRHAPRAVAQLAPHSWWCSTRPLLSRPQTRRAPKPSTATPSTALAGPSMACGSSWRCPAHSRRHTMANSIHTCGRLRQSERLFNKHGQISTPAYLREDLLRVRHAPRHRPWRLQVIVGSRNSSLLRQQESIPMSRTSPCARSPRHCLRSGTSSV